MIDIIMAIVILTGLNGLMWSWWRGMNFGKRVDHELEMERMRMKALERQADRQVQEIAMLTTGAAAREKRTFVECNGRFCDPAKGSHERDCHWSR